MTYFSSVQLLRDRSFDFRGGGRVGGGEVGGGAAGNCPLLFVAKARIFFSQC